MLNSSKDTVVADPEPTTPGFVVPFSSNEGVLCNTPEIPSLNSSTLCARQSECLEWVKTRMYGLEKILGVSYEGFEWKVSKLFFAIESS
jgi:hypothetical protein